MGEKKDYLRTYQFHRYQAKRFRNPYFQGQKKRRSFNARRWIVAAGVLAVLIGLIYLIGFAPFWMLQGSRVEGLQFMDSGQITQTVDGILRGRRWVIFPARNRLFFPKQRLVEALNTVSSFASLSVAVEKKTVVVRVTERVSQVLWSADHQTFYVDEQGTVIRALSEGDAANLVWHGSTQPSLNGQEVQGPYPQIAWLSSLPLVVNQQGSEVQPGDHVLSPGGIAGVIAMEGLLREAGLPVREFTVERTDSVWAAARLMAGFDVLFDTSVDARSQVGYLTDILQKSVPDRSRLDYVDVRFGNHVYFKNR